MRTGIQHRASGLDRTSLNKGVATIFVTLAGLCSIVSLAGWALNVDFLRGFGARGDPVWPHTAIGYLALSLGFLTVTRGQLGIARLLWSLPLAIAVLSLIQGLGGFDLGIDHLLFGSKVDQYPAAHPGRPGISAIAIMLLLTTLGYRSGKRRWLQDELGKLIIVASVALGTIAVVTILLLNPGDPISHRALNNIPSSFIAALLLAAWIAGQGGFGLAQLLGSKRAELSILRVLLPIALVFSLVPWILDLTFVHEGLMSPVASALLIVLFNVLIVASTTYWTASRVARQQSTLSEFGEALDMATVAMTNADGRITHWSHGCEELYGWPASEALGQRKYAMLQSRCEDPASPGLPCQTGPRVQSLIERRRDGTEILVLEHTHEVEIPGRDPLVVLSMTDVSGTASAMAALRASEELLDVAAAVHRLGVFEWDVQSGRIDWSPGTEQRLGVIPGSIADFESWRALIEPDDVEDILDTIARTVADRADEFSFRCRFLQPNGEVRAVEGSARAFYDEEDNLVRSVGTMMDVTERDEREAMLRGREAQLRSILRTVPDAMVVVDQDGAIREFSATAEALWGYRSADVLGRNIAMLAPEDDRIRYTGAFERFLQTGDVQFMSRVVTGTGETADGRRFPLEFHTGQAQADGQTLFTIFFRDLSERLATEERLSELNSELAHVSRQSAMTELAADIAHELNQPLSATANFLAAARMLIEKGEEIERIDDLLRMGSEQTQRAGQIIRRMRDFMSRHEVEMRPESVEQTVRDAAELVLVGTGQFHIRLSYDFDPNASQIFADRIQVQQVLVNILRNAMQALRELPPEKREILISSRPIEDEMIEISVCDSGPGIPENVLKQLFNRFVTTKRSGVGMGIGLSISTRIIEAHGGILSAENRPEGGACFRFTLPAVGEEVEL